MDAANLIGILGACLVLLAYGLLSLEKLRADQPLYQWLNLSSTVLMLCSLAVHWNLPAAVTQVVFLAANLISLVRIYRQRRRA